jgi:hypothetical protein
VSIGKYLPVIKIIILFLSSGSKSPKILSRTNYRYISERAQNLKITRENITQRVMQNPRSRIRQRIPLETDGNILSEI